jgi:hypothetical protein
MTRRCVKITLRNDTSDFEREDKGTFSERAEPRRLHNLSRTGISQNCIAIANHYRLIWKVSIDKIDNYMYMYILHYCRFDN